MSLMAEGVRDDYLLTFDIDDDKVRFDGEKVLYKAVEGPPWTHFVHFDSLVAADRAYHLVMANGAFNAKVTRRQITTSATDPIELDMAVVGAELREQIMKRRALGGGR
jgi:hypothetical protein